MKIGELATITGTKAETIRFYEKIGLLAEPARTGGNYRAYGPAHLSRLSFIRRSRDLGFSLEQVRALLSLSDDRSQPCEAIDSMAREHLRAVDAKIADLMALKRELEALVGQCGSGSVSDCRIVEALEPS
ncbi:MAG: MerR family transcriptional regulator [Sphingomonas sp.]|nr:MAG: MerR family transcriptional regulator [Sphingomonas sp.]